MILCTHCVCLWERRCRYWLCFSFSIQCNCYLRFAQRVSSSSRIIGKYACINFHLILHLRQFCALNLEVLITFQHCYQKLYNHTNFIVQLSRHHNLMSRCIKPIVIFCASIHGNCYNINFCEQYRTSLCSLQSIH